jgi:hypothetical protein
VKFKISSNGNGNGNGNGNDNGNGQSDEAASGAHLRAAFDSLPSAARTRTFRTMGPESAEAGWPLFW